jgi:hypothetical protein
MKSGVGWQNAPGGQPPAHWKSGVMPHGSGHVHVGLHSRNAPVGLLGSGHLGAPGGSHSSPGSTTPFPHAARQSQQLPVPAMALPPLGARHFAALLRMLHFVLPLAVV